jgi:hypothetical protein
MPLTALAAGELPGPQLPPVLITEVQAGSTASASEEFIELTNTTAASVDFGAFAWQLQIAGSTAINWDSPLRSIPLTGVLAPHETYVVASQYTSSGLPVQYLPGTARLWFSAGIAASAGHVRLVYTTNQTLADTTCGQAQTVVDEMEWSAPKDGAAASPSLDGRTVLLTTKSSGVPAGSSVQRLLAPGAATYQDGGSDAADFAVSTPASPGAINGTHATAVIAGSSNVPGLPADGCSPKPPVGSDADPPDDPPQQDGGQDPGSLPDDSPESDPGEEAPAANQGLESPRLSELLPNPGTPQTDAADEFIELYNPNTAVFDLSGYALEVGTTTTHRYTFPEGTLLQPLAYTAFFSATTGLGLSNSGGQARLLASQGSVVSAADSYGTAKDNQAWALWNGKWQWTLTPTPNAANAVLLPTVKAAVTTAHAAKTVKPKAVVKPKAARVKAIKTSKTKKRTAQVASTVQTFAADPAANRTPLHPGILAGIGVLAVLYGAYEYRQDMANYFRRLRNYRTAGRENRQEPSGRGDD